MGQDPRIRIKKGCSMDQNDTAARGRVEGGNFNVRVNPVGPGAVQPVGDEDTSANGQDVEVEVVVDQVELLTRCERASGSVNFTGELVVCRVVFVFPKLK